MYKHYSGEKSDNLVNEEFELDIPCEIEKGSGVSETALLIGSAWFALLRTKEGQEYRMYRRPATIAELLLVKAIQNKRNAAQKNQSPQHPK